MPPIIRIDTSRDGFWCIYEWLESTLGKKTVSKSVDWLDFYNFVERMELGAGYFYSHYQNEEWEMFHVITKSTWDHEGDYIKLYVKIADPTIAVQFKLLFQ